VVQHQEDKDLKRTKLHHQGSHHHVDRFSDLPRSHTHDPDHLLWIPYGILLPLGIIKMNKIQQELREEGADDQP